MRNKVKKTMSVALSALLIAGALSAAGCKKAPDTEETLEVYCYNAGYGYKWCEDMLEAFKQKDWVKEKYPNLTVIFSQNQVGSFAQSKLTSGAGANSIDLFFAVNAFDLAGVDSKGNDYLAELTELVYNKTVPGEQVTFKEKTLDSYNQSNRYNDVSDTSGREKYYFTSWAAGTDGILYNADLLKQYSIEVPRTTDEWLASLAKIKAAKGENGYVIMQSKDAPNYVDYLFPIWWAQYEGAQGISDFYNGIDSGRRSTGIFDQQGRLESLKVLEQTVNKTNDYVDPNSFTYEYIVAQTEFLRGKAVYHMNGDWFDNEMKAKKAEVIANGGENYDIKMMRTPVISAIVEKTPSIKAVAAARGISADAALSIVVKAVDAHEDGVEGVSDEDYEIIKEARSVIHSIGPNHTAFIPSYAVGKNVATDFLLFMATDEANEIYSKATGGATLPFRYDIAKSAPETYAQFSDFQKDKLSFINDEFTGCYVIPSENAFPLVRFGGLKPFVNSNYYTTFSMSGNTKTPQDYFNETKAYWTDAKWTDALSKAGIG